MRMCGDCGHKMMMPGSNGVYIASRRNSVVILIQGRSKVSTLWSSRLVCWVDWSDWCATPEYAYTSGYCLATKPHLWLRALRAPEYILRRFRTHTYSNADLLPTIHMVNSDNVRSDPIVQAAGKLTMKSSLLATSPEISPRIWKEVLYRVRGPDWSCNLGGL